MPNYCTVSDVRAALTPGGIDDDGATAASLANWQIEDAIFEAQDMINIYLAGYEIDELVITEVDDGDPNAQDLPITVAADPVRRWTRSIAAFYAALTYRKNKDLPEDDPIRLRYNMVIGYLQMVRTGEMQLNLPLDPDYSGTPVEIFNLYDGTLFDLSDFQLGPAGQGVQHIWPAQRGL